MDPRHLTMAGLAALALFAAGCGGGDDKSSSSTSGGLSRDDYVQATRDLGGMPADEAPTAEQENTT